MSDRRDRDYLGDIRSAIERYTSHLTREQFERDEKTQDAVIRNLEVIGEAANCKSAPPSDESGGDQSGSPLRENEKDLRGFGKPRRSRLGIMRACVFHAKREDNARGVLARPVQYLHPGRASDIAAEQSAAR